MRDELMAQLRETYGDEIYERDVAPMSDDQLIELAENLKKGMPIATPVFDGARDGRYRGDADRAGLDRSGQVWLTDGRTGERSSGR